MANRLSVDNVCYNRANIQSMDYLKTSFGGAHTQSCSDIMPSSVLGITTGRLRGSYGFLEFKPELDPGKPNALLAVPLTYCRKCLTSGPVERHSDVRYSISLLGISVKHMSPK